MNFVGLAFIIYVLPTQSGTSASNTQSTMSLSADAQPQQVELEKQKIRQVILNRPAVRANFDVEKSTREALQDPRINSKKSRSEQLMILLDSLWRQFSALFSDPSLRATSLLIRWVFLSLALTLAVLTLIYTIRQLRPQSATRRNKLSLDEAQAALQNILGQAQELFAQGRHEQALRLATEAWIDLIRQSTEAEDPNKLTLCELEVQPFFTRMNDALRLPAEGLFAMYTDSILADRALDIEQLESNLRQLQNIKKEHTVTTDPNNPSPLDSASLVPSHLAPGHLSPGHLSPGHGDAARDK